MTQLACLGDLHLSHTVWDDHPDIRDDAILNTERFLIAASSMGCSIMLCGDIFDVVNPPPSVIREFRRLMDICQHKGTPVYYFQGNHDKRPTPWPQALHDHPVYVGAGVQFKIGTLTCTALDYMGRERIEQAITAVNENPPDVLFLHQAVKQALKFENAWNCDLDWISPKVRKVILGDIHKEKDMSFPGGKAHYTGASSPRDISELGEKSFLVLKEDLSVSRIPLPTRPMHRADLSITAQQDLMAWAEAALEKSKELSVSNLQPPVLFLGYSEQETAVATKLRDVLTAMKVKVVLQPLKAAEHGTYGVDDKPGDTVVELLNKRLDKGQYKREHALVLDLWQSPEDVIDIIAAHRKAFEHANSKT